MYSAFDAILSLPLRPEQGFGQSPSCWRQGLNCIQQKQQFPPQSQLDQSGGKTSFFVGLYGEASDHISVLYLYLSGQETLYHEILASSMSTTCRLSPNFITCLIRRLSSFESLYILQVFNHCFGSSLSSLSFFGDQSRKIKSRTALL